MSPDSVTMVVPAAVCAGVFVQEGAFCCGVWVWVSLRKAGALIEVGEVWLGPRMSAAGWLLLCRL